MTPNARDVLCGRGGGTRRHPGNKNYRSLINSSKPIYLISTKEEKTSISRSIVAAIRDQQGQFLEQRRPPRVGGGTKDEQNKITEWYDIGDAKATEKTSQALREGQPKLRQKMIEKGIIKDVSDNSNSNRRSSAVEVIIRLTKPSLQAAIMRKSSIPVAKPNNYYTNSNEKSIVHGNNSSDLFDVDSYINIIGNDNHNIINSQTQHQLPSLGYLSLENLLQKKNKLMCISNSDSRNSNQYQKMHRTCERLDQHQQDLAVSYPYKNQQQPHNYFCEDDDVSMTRCIETTCHHSNRMIKDLDDCLNHSIMTFDADFDNDDDDLLDDTVVSDDQGNCSDNDNTDNTNTIKIVRFINKSCIYDPHIQQQKKRMWEECKSSLEKEQTWHKEVQRNTTIITDGYNQNNYQHHHDTNHHQHFDRHTENKHRDHDTIQFTSNDFKYVMSSDYNNDYRNYDNDSKNYHDDDDDNSISLDSISSAVFPKETGHRRHSL